MRYFIQIFEWFRTRVTIQNLKLHLHYNQTCGNRSIKKHNDVWWKICHQFGVVLECGSSRQIANKRMEEIKEGKFRFILNSNNVNVYSVSCVCFVLLVPVKFLFVFLCFCEFTCVFLCICCVVCLRVTNLGYCINTIATTIGCICISF